ncbi:MAG TPA: cellobiose phosphorylase, partial [Sphingomonadaceae bacterium]|nr:cellobiose phosphorylase [Sphingomonadaceae bacterium]
MGRDPVDPIAARARETGQLHAQRCGSGSPRPIPALNELERIELWLRKALDAAAAAEPAASSAAEWLLDNGYRVQRAVLQVKQDLPRGFYRRLRPLGEGSAAGEPLCLLIAHDMLHATHFQLSREAVLVYLRGYQEEYPLTIAELWAIPAMLRIACLERLVGGFDALFPSVPMPFAPSASCRMFLEETAPNERVARGIANLGAISGIAWKDVFDAVSLVERVLADDPAGVYAGMDFETRDEYRRAVERIACRCDKAELAIADRVVGLARAEECSPRNHVGYWLIGQGLAELERENGACTPIRIRVARLLLRHPGKVYTLALFLLGLAGLAVPAAYLAEWAATPLQWVLGITLSILPATVISVTLV